MTIETRTRWVLSGWLVLLFSAFLAAQGGPFTAQIENFWRLISTGGRPFVKLIVDGNTLVVDNVNHRVGVGVTSPAFRMHVGGGTGAFNFVEVDTPNGVVQTVFGGDSSVGGAGVVGTLSNHPLTFRINNQPQWNISTAGHFLATTDGTVDIGQSGATRPRNYFGSGTGSFGGAVTGLNFQPSATGSVTFVGRSSMSSSADKLFQITNNGFTTGLEYNLDAATLGACGTGTITTGSRGSAGGATATGATSCTVNFTTSFTNAAFCSANDITGARALSVTSATGSITVGGLTAGDVFTYTCLGRF
jgi:hypothetical protein